MIKAIELFGGIGAASCALKRQFNDVEIVDYVELDKHAVKSYNAMHWTDFKPTDINDVKMEDYEEVDILIAGWPCQDYSVAGKGLGLEGTRSNLILLTVAKIKEMKNKPKHILLENVKGLLSKKHEKDLEYIKELFNELGYNWDQALLNSKYFGVPQSRERVFILLTRKDIAQVTINHLEKRNTVDKVLRDVLDFNEPAFSVSAFDIGINNPLKANKYNEAGVPYMLYFTNEMSQYNGKVIEVDADKFNKQKREEINKVATLGTLEPEFKEHSFNQKKHLLGVDGVTKTLRAGDCDTENKIIFKSIPFKQDSNIQGIEGVSQTLVAQGPDFKNKIMYEGTKLHYRKLSSLECWRLMGFPDALHNECVRAGVSNSQLCKQAGNSIVVNVLEEIFKIIFQEVILTPPKTKDNVWDMF